MFVSVMCGAHNDMCTTVDDRHCTNAIRCEELGQTCGAGGRCTAIDVMPTEVDSSDASVVTDADIIDAAGSDVSVPTGRTVVQVSAGGNFTCVRRAEGTVSCWGSNSSGQLGGSWTDTRLGAVDTPGLTDAIAIAAGNDHACAIRSDHTVVCWGNNSASCAGATILPASLAQETRYVPRRHNLS
jgi:alpha-tubulin suppressor-like RCC1 family protein